MLKKSVRSPSSKAGPPNRPMKRNSRSSVLVSRPLRGSGAPRWSRRLLEFGLGCGFAFEIVPVGVFPQVRQAARPPLRPGLATAVPPALRGGVRLSAALGGPLRGWLG